VLYSLILPSTKPVTGGALTIVPLSVQSEEISFAFNIKFDVEPESVNEEQLIAPKPPPPWANAILVKASTIINDITIANVMNFLFIFIDLLYQYSNLNKLSFN
jgi:hypothetical protein